MNKSITICYCLRNDDYQKKLIEKFIFSLNFNLFNIKKLSLLNRFKVLIIDLGSEIPLNKEILLHDPDFKDIVKILYVSKESIKKSKPDKYKLSFFIEKGMNLYLNKIETDYCITSTMDNLFSTIFLQNLTNLIDTKLITNFKNEESFFLIPRMIIPLDFILRNPDNIEVSKFIEKLPINNLNLHPHKDFIGGGFGALFASKKVWYKSGGFDEDVEENHSNDSEIYFKLINNFLIQNLGNFGIICHKMENSQFSDRQKKIRIFGPRKPLKKLTKKNFLNKGIEYEEKYIEENNIKSVEYFNVFGENKLDFDLGEKEQNFINIQRIFYKCHFFEKNFNYFKTTFQIINILNNFKIKKVIRLNSKSFFEIYSICKLFKGIKFISIINSLNNINKFHIPIGTVLSKIKSAFFQPIQLEDFNELNLNFLTQDNNYLIVVNESDLLFTHAIKKYIEKNSAFILIIKNQNKISQLDFEEMRVLYEDINHLILCKNDNEIKQMKNLSFLFLLKNYLKMTKSYFIYKLKNILKIQNA